MALAALGIGLLLAAALGEGMARLYFKLLGGGALAGEVHEGTLGQYDPLLGYRLLPSAHVRLHSSEYDIQVRVNSQGLRQDTEVPYQRVDGSRRILLAGDSFTFGANVDVSESFAGRLADCLSSTEIVNMGVSGWGTDQQLLYYETEGVKYSPDIVVLGYLTEHIRRNALSARMDMEGRMVPKPHFVLHEGGLELTNVPVPEPRPPTAEELAREHVIEARRSTGLPIPFKDALREHSALYQLVHARFKLAVHQLLHTDPNPYPEYDVARPEWALTRAILLRFAQAARDHGSDFLLVLIPTRDFVEKSYANDQPHRMMVELAEQSGIPVLDLLPAFRTAYAAGAQGLYFSIDSHWAAPGHAFAAQEISNYLASHWSWRLDGQPPRCRTSLRADSSRQQAFEGGASRNSAHADPSVRP